MSSTPSATDKGAAIRHAMRTATGATLCLVVGEWLSLKHTNLAVWTTYMVMAQHPYSSFQKGVERIVGRVLGVLVGLVAATWLVQTPLLSQAFLSFVPGVLLLSLFRRPPCLYLSQRRPLCSGPLRIASQAREWPGRRLVWLCAWPSCRRDSGRYR